MEFVQQSRRPKSSNMFLIPMSSEAINLIVQIPVFIVLLKIKVSAKIRAQKMSEDCEDCLR